MGVVRLGTFSSSSTICVELVVISCVDDAFCCVVVVVVVWSSALNGLGVFVRIPCDNEVFFPTLFFLIFSIAKKSSVNN